MANLDRTGPLGQGPMTGRGLGRADGRGKSVGAVRPIGSGRGRTKTGRGLGGSKMCTCPNCGYSEPHVRGVPCTQKKCPKCETPMRGVFCS